MRHLPTAALLALALAACGDDTSNPGATTNADAANADATNDASSDDASTGSDDATDDASTADATADAADTPCVRPSLECRGPCRIDFFGVSPGRDNVASVDIVSSTNSALSVVGVAILEGGSPYVRLSDSWFGYIERAAGGTWQPSADGLGFDVVGTPIPIGVGESFIVDVAFDEHEDTGPQCPGGDTRACAELVVSFDDCSGGTVDLSVPVQI